MRGNPVYYYLILLSYTIIKCPTAILTLIHGCLSACAAVIRRAGLTVNMLLMRFFASVVTVSHSGDGYYTHRHAIKHHSLQAILTVQLAIYAVASHATVLRLISKLKPRSSANAKSTPCPSCLVGVLYDISREKIC